MCWKYLISLLIVLFIEFPQHAIAQPIAPATSPLHDFDVLQASRNWGELVRRVDQLLVVDQGNPALWNMRSGYLVQALRYNEAIYSSRKAIDIWGESPQAGIAWVNCGIALWRAGRQQEAIVALREATRINPDTTWAWLNLWGILTETGRYSELAPVIEQVQRLDPPVAASFLKILGNPLSLTPDIVSNNDLSISTIDACDAELTTSTRRTIDEATATLEQGNAINAISILEGAKDSIKKSECRFGAEASEVRSLLVIAYVQSLRISEATGQNVKVRNFDQSIKTANAIAGHLAEKFGENSSEYLRAELAIAYFRYLSNDHSAALGPTLEALDKAKQFLGPSDKTTRWLMFLVGAIYNALGQTEDSRVILTQLYSLALNDYGEDDEFTAVTFGEMVIADKKMSELPASHEQAVAIHTKVFGRGHILTLGALGSQAAALRRQGKMDDAFLLYQEIRSRAAEFVEINSPDILTLDYAQASALYQDRQFERANSVLKNLVPSLQRQLGQQAPQTLSARLLQAYVATSSGDFGKAALLGHQIISDVEVLRNDISLTPEARQQFFARYVGLYKAQALSVLSLNPDEAFRLAEAAKARTLLESVSLTQANRFGVLDLIDQKKVDQFEQQLQELSVRLFEAAGSPARLRIDLERQRIHINYSNYRKELKFRNTRYRALTEFQIVTARDGLESTLDDDSVFISYLVSDNTVLGFALSRNEGLMAVSTNLKDLTASVEALRDGLKKQTGDEHVKPLAKLLGEKLISPFEVMLKNKRRLIISPDGPLAFLPFEVLLINGQHLIDRHDVSYTPSLSVLALIKQRDIAYGKMDGRLQLFAMGGAEYNVATGVGTLRSNSMVATDSRNAITLLHRSVPDADAPGKAFRLLNINWETLPGTEKEVKAVASIFGSGESAVFVGRKASEFELQRLNKAKELAKYRYMLFSTHGYVSPEEPALSAIVLSQTDTTTVADGYVTASEWPSYDLRSDLIVLSACDTGSGKIMNGEGVLGLPYALYVAGNKNLLLTLWPIADDATQEFMQEFFTRLKSGDSAAVALSAVKRKFAQSDQYSHPMYWAPFVLYGY